MLAALQQGGVVIGVMADNLLRSATSAKWRKGLMEGYSVLVSPFYPETGFNVGNAMARNKYIYCLADSALVVHSGKKGGTLNGAEENLKKNWVPLWVKPTSDNDAANTDLVAKGGHWCAADAENINISDFFSIETDAATPAKETQISLFSVPEQPELFAASKADADKPVAEDTLCESAVMLELPAEVEERPAKSIDFYQLFIAELHQLAASPVTLDVLIENTGLNKSQLNDWMKRAADEGVVKKLSRPVRYQVTDNKRN